MINYQLETTNISSDSNLFKLTRLSSTIWLNILLHSDFYVEVGKSEIDCNVFSLFSSLSRLKILSLSSVVRTWNMFILDSLPSLTLINASSLSRIWRFDCNVRHNFPLFDAVVRLNISLFLDLDLLRYVELFCVGIQNDMEIK